MGICVWDNDKETSNVKIPLFISWQKTMNNVWLLTFHLSMLAILVNYICSCFFLIWWILLSRLELFKNTHDLKIKGTNIKNIKTVVLLQLNITNSLMLHDVLTCSSGAENS